MDVRIRLSRSHVRPIRPGGRERHGLAWAALLAGAAIALTATMPARAAETPEVVLQNKRCLDCHGQEKIVNLPPDERRTMLDAARDEPLPPAKPRPGLYVTADQLKAGVHGDVTCVSCHADAEKLPHRAKLAPATCGNCHENAGAAYRRGIHAEIAAQHPDATPASPDTNAPACATCHGAHDILAVKDKASRVYPLNVVKLCGDCHEKHTQRSATGRSQSKIVKSYLESVHGQMVTKGGLVVAATCADCHRAHDIQPSNKPESSVHRDHVPQTCGTCHVGVVDTYEKSIHGRKLAEGDPKAPVCTDCHTAHRITRASTAGFKLDIVNECGQCHDKPLSPGGQTLYQTYRQSYHGQVESLGSLRGARCSDCHGSHDIKALDDPDSRVVGDRKRETCAKCHENATASFAKFEPHADHTDGRRFPLLHGIWLYFVVLMSVTFGFYGVHTVLWFGRSLLDRIKHGPAPRHDGAEPGIRRFRKIDRVNHAIIIVSFFGLTLTGMPLLFSDQPWAAVLAGLFGGAHAAGVFHRLFAVMLMCNFAVHFAGVVNRIRKHSLKKVVFGPNSLLPRWRDVTDFAHMLRWFFTGGRKPTFDKWTYWEKFDYWAEIFGTSIIGFTGLMLWFPNTFSHLMPGWMFNVASIVHGYEALLAVGFIFTIHFFNANLRPEKFPVDTVMFTGYMSEHEFKEERGAEYERVVAAGELEKLKVAPMAAWKRRAAIAAGIFAMVLGITMVALIVMAGLSLL
jgi:cytochrome b subunit of formate dehydrogenase